MSCKCEYSSECHNTATEAVIVIPYQDIIKSMVFYCGKHVQVAGDEIDPDGMYLVSRPLPKTQGDN